MGQKVPGPGESGGGLTMEKTKKTKAAERTYWCVISEFGDNNKIKARILSRKAKKIPEGFCFRHVPNVDTWTDWFDSKEKARERIAEIEELKMNLKLYGYA
jgi:hypothetical protein